MGYTPENNPYIPGDPYSYDLKWMVDELKKAINLYTPLSQNFTDLYNYVHDYLDNLDFPAEVSTKIDQMAEDGTLANYISEYMNIITPELFGAKGDGIEDDTEALQAAFNWLTDNRASTLIGANTYKISDTITVTANSARTNKTVQLDGKLVSTFRDKPVIVFSACEGWRINVNAESDTGDYYGGYDFAGINDYHYGLLPYVGIILRNGNRCEVSGYLRNFNVGLRMEGLSGGCVYNDVHGISVWNCAYGIELYANTSGWVNSNYISACTVSTNSDAPNRNKAVPLHIFSSYGYPSNANIVEGDYMAVSPAPTILVENGQFNQFNIRAEGTPTILCDSSSSSVFRSQLNTVISAPGDNLSLNAYTDIMANYEELANIDASTVEQIFWKGAGIYYGLGSNILDTGAVVGGVFKDADTIFSAPTDISKMQSGLGKFIDIKNLGSIATSVKGTGDIRLLIYLFDENKQLLVPSEHYLGSPSGDSMTAADNYWRLVSGASAADGKFHLQNFDSDVRYVFITTNGNWEQLRIFAKRLPNLCPCVTHYSNTLSWPYFSIQNTTIITNHPKVGKRFYSTVDGNAYYCSAVAGDGTETWTT